MEEFSKLLEENKAKSDKDQAAGKFELRKVERDSEGKERYIKTSEDDAMFKAKMQQMATFAKQELKNATFEERWKWIEDKKADGNDYYKKQRYDEAIDTYLACLCGFEFGKTISNEKKADVELKLKVPILNNMALCLMN